MARHAARDKAGLLKDLGNPGFRGTDINSIIRQLNWGEKKQHIEQWHQGCLIPWGTFPNYKYIYFFSYIFGRHWLYSQSCYRFSCTHISSYHLQHPGRHEMGLKWNLLCPCWFTLMVEKTSCRAPNQISGNTFSLWEKQTTYERLNIVCQRVAGFYTSCHRIDREYFVYNLCTDCNWVTGTGCPACRSHQPLLDCILKFSDVNDMWFIMYNNSVYCIKSNTLVQVALSNFIGWSFYFSELDNVLCYSCLPVNLQTDMTAVQSCIIMDIVAQDDMRFISLCSSLEIVN